MGRCKTMLVVCGSKSTWSLLNGNLDENPGPAPGRPAAPIRQVQSGAKRAWKKRRYRGSWTISKPRAWSRASKHALTDSATTSM